MDKMQAVLDADFIKKINEIKKADPEQLFQKLMDELNCLPVVHPYVIEHELFSCRLAQSMREKGVLCCKEYSDFLPEEKTERYEKKFRDLYRKMTSDENGQASEAHDDIFAHHAGYSYGEVHSVIMAAELGIPVFYSNDHSGKTLCKYFRHLETRTMKEIREEFKGKEDCAITKEEWKYLCRST